MESVKMSCFVTCDAALRSVLAGPGNRRHLPPWWHAMCGQTVGSQDQDRTWTGSDSFSDLRECDDFVQYIL